MSLTTLIIIAIISFIVSILFYVNDFNLLARIMLFPPAIAVVILLIIPDVGKITVLDSKTKEFNIEAMYYNKEGYLRKLIDDEGNAHPINEFYRYETISIAYNDKVSYTERTENIIADLLFVHTHMERVICEVKLPKAAYYDYMYGRDSNSVPVE